MLNLVEHSPNPSRAKLECIVEIRIVEHTTCSKKIRVEFVINFLRVFPRLE